MGANGNAGFYGNHSGAALMGPSYGYGDVGGPGASYGYYGNGLGAVEQWQWTTSMTRAYCAPPQDHAIAGQVLGCGQGGTARYDLPQSYLPGQSHVRQLAELSDSDVDDRKDWYRFHAL